MNSIDIFIQNYFSASRDPFLTDWLYVFTTLFNFSWGTVFIVLCVAVLIYLVRNLSYALLFVSALSFGTAVVFLLKAVFAVDRPENGFMSVVGKSFPSNHATLATIFFVMLMYILEGHLNSFLRLVFRIFCISSILIVAFSRVYLGVHWFSDVFFGIIIGVLVCFLCINIFKRVIDRRGITSMVK